MLLRKEKIKKEGNYFLCNTEVGIQEIITLVNK